MDGARQAVRLFEEHLVQHYREQEAVLEQALREHGGEPEDYVICELARPGSAISPEQWVRNITALNPEYRFVTFLPESFPGRHEALFKVIKEDE